MTKNTTACLVGLSATSRDAAPFYDPSVDCFSLNDGYRVFPQDVPWAGWFELHQWWDMLRRSGRYVTGEHHVWLSQPHDFPIYMKQHSDSYPASVKYPVEPILEKWGLYHCSSASWMLAFALYKGYKKILLYGWEMGTDTEYFYQRANFEYWIGRAEGMGVQVLLPENCSLLRGDLYGFEDEAVATRSYLQTRRSALLEQEESAKTEVLMYQGQLQELQYWMSVGNDQNPQFMERFNKQVETLTLAEDKMTRIQAQRAEIEYQMRWHDLQNLPAGRIKSFEISKDPTQTELIEEHHEIQTSESDQSV